MSDNISFMAWGTGKDTDAAPVSINHYVGVGSFKVMAVNPTKEELSAIYGREVSDASVNYTTVEDDGSKKTRVDFILQSTPGLCKDEKFITKVSYFISSKKRVSRDESKISVINTYGQSTFIPVEDFQNNRVPENQSWYIKDGMRAALVGEAELTAFMKEYLSIPAVSFRDRDTGETKFIPNKEDACAQFDIAKIAEGDVSEIKQLLKLKPNNEIKMLLGVRTTPEGREYQDVFKEYPIRLFANRIDKLRLEVENSKANGKYANTNFGDYPYMFSKYTVSPTNMEDNGNNWNNKPENNVDTSVIDSWI